MGDTQLDRAQVGTHILVHKPLTKWPDCRQLGECLDTSPPAQKLLLLLMSVHARLSYSGERLTTMVMMQQFNFTALICVYISITIP